MDDVHVVKDTTWTVEKKTFVLVLPYLGSISWQTWIKLKKSLGNTLNYCKLQVALKSETRLGNVFQSNDWIPKYLASSIFYKFQCRLCTEYYYGEYVSHLNVRIDYHMWCVAQFGRLPRKKLRIRTLFTQWASDVWPWKFKSRPIYLKLCTLVNLKVPKTNLT